MSNRVSRALTLSLTLLTLTLAPSVSQAQSAPGSDLPGAGGAMRMSEREALVNAIVQKWGNHVATRFGADVTLWRDRLAVFVANADETNLREAVTRDSYEGAMATLLGRGDRVSDAAVLDRLASRGLTADAVIGGKFGDLNQDLAYTPVTPCRIVDTRSTVAGAIANNGTRSFVAINASSFTSQGGSATNCGTLGLNATAVAINLTAVTPSSAGYATAYPYGTSQPLTASLNYSSGAVVNNALIVQIPNPLSSFDFTLYTFAQSHYVVDIVGYFAPPLATALQCQDTANTTVAGIAVNGTANALAPACATGYTQTATNCETSSWDVPIVFIHAGTCSARNTDTTPQDLRASRTCCRVPGR